MKDLNKKVEKFISERDWTQFHTPKNLVMAISGEVGELNEIFQWLKEDETFLENISELNLEKAKEEIADIFIYLLSLTNSLKLDVNEIIENKLEKNSIKYPVEKFKGIRKKYNEF
jgi:dCTP diphosphatase